MNAFLSPPSFMGLVTKKAAIRLALEQGESAWAEGYKEGRLSSDHWRDTLPPEPPRFNVYHLAGIVFLLSMLLVLVLSI